MRPAATALLLLAAVAAAAALRAAPSREGTCHLRPGSSAAERRDRHAKECPALVHKYMEAHTADLEEEQDVSKLVFFLHVPRTGESAALWGLECAGWLGVAEMGPCRSPGSRLWQSTRQVT